MRRDNNTAVTEYESRICLVYHIGLGNRVDLIKPNDLGIPTEADFIAAADDVQMSDPAMVADSEFLCPQQYIEMSDLDVIAYLTGRSVNYRESNAHPFTDLVSKKPP